MTYLHCPTCRCAYDVTATPACPSCGVRAGAPADAAEDVIAAAEQLARAIARATPAELAKAQAELAMREANRALTAPSGLVHTATSMLRAVRAAIAPPPVEPVVTGRAQTALLTTVVLALLTRVPRPRPALRAWAETHVTPRVNAARALLARDYN